MITTPKKAPQNPQTKLIERSTNWCFTLFKDPETFANNLPVFRDINQGTIRYICGQVEASPTTGTLHFQGYMQTKNTQRFTGIKKILNDNTVHLEAQRAKNSDQARDYTRKEETSHGDWVEAGEYKQSGQGKRNDIDAFKDSVKSGMSMRDMLSLFPDMVAKYPKLYSTVRSLYRPERAPDYEHSVVLCFGEPGTGKTRWAREQEDLYVQPLSNGTTWFDGFDQHTCALLDDFAGKMSKLSLTNTLQLLDRYPIAVPVKGGHVWWMPERLLITTNIHPRGWYEWKKREVHWRALKRRFTEIRVFEEDEDHTVTVYSTKQEVDEFLEDRDLWPEEENTDLNFGASGAHNF